VVQNLVVPAAKDESPTERRQRRGIRENLIEPAIEDESPGERRQRRAVRQNLVAPAVEEDREEIREFSDAPAPTESIESVRGAEDAEDFGDIPVENPVTGNRLESDLEPVATGGRDLATVIGERTIDREASGRGAATGPIDALGTAVAGERAALAALEESGVVDDVPEEGLVEQGSEAAVAGFADTANLPQRALDAKEAAEFVATQPDRLLTDAGEDAAVAGIGAIAAPTPLSATAATASVGGPVSAGEPLLDESESEQFAADVAERGSQAAAAAARDPAGSAGRLLGNVAGGAAVGAVTPGVSGGLAALSRARRAGRRAVATDGGSEGGAVGVREFISDERGEIELTVTRDRDADGADGGGEDGPPDVDTREPVDPADDPEPVVTDDEVDGLLGDDDDTGSSAESDSGDSGTSSSTRTVPVEDFVSAADRSEGDQLADTGPTSVDLRRIEDARRARSDDRGADIPDEDLRAVTEMDEGPTGVPRSELDQLLDAGETDSDLSAAEVSRRIDELERELGADPGPPTADELSPTLESSLDLDAVASPRPASELDDATATAVGSDGAAGGGEAPAVSVTADADADGAMAAAAGDDSPGGGSQALAAEFDDGEATTASPEMPGEQRTTTTAPQSVSDDVTAAATPAPVDASNTLATSAVMAGGAGIGGLLPPPGETTTSEGVSVSDTATTAEPTDVDVAVDVDDQAAVDVGADTDAVPIPDEFEDEDTQTDTDDQIDVQQQPETQVEMDVTATVDQEQRQGLRLDQLLRADQRLRGLQATRTRTDTGQRVREDELQELELETRQLLDADTRTRALTRGPLVLDEPGLRARPPRPREDESEEDDGDGPVLGLPVVGGGGGRATDAPLTTGFLAETIATAATRGFGNVGAPSQSVLASQPRELQLTGELPTAAEVSGDAETRGRIEELTAALSFETGSERP
jgi:hypothetical protein